MSRARITLPKLLASLPHQPSYQAAPIRQLNQLPPVATSPPTVQSIQEGISRIASIGSSKLEPIIVQPDEWKERWPNSFWLVTRTKFRLKDEEGNVVLRSDSGRLEGSSKGKGVQKSNPGEEKLVDEDDIEAEEESLFDDTTGEAESSQNPSVNEESNGTKAFGKAWGVLFWNGQPKYPHRSSYLPSTSSTSYVPPTRIRTPSPHHASWSLLPFTSLPSSTQSAISSLKTHGRTGSGRLDLGLRTATLRNKIEGILENEGFRGGQEGEQKLVIGIRTSEGEKRRVLEGVLKRWEARKAQLETGERIKPEWRRRVIEDD